MWIWIVLGVVVIVCLIAASPITIQFYFSRMKDNDKAWIDVKWLYGLVKLHYKIPLLRFEGLLKGLEMRAQKKGVGAAETKDENITPHKIEQMIENIKLLLKSTERMNDWWKETLAHLKCGKLRWETRVGIGDAAGTAVTAGMLWGVKSSLLGYLFQFIQLNAKPQIAVSPQFNAMHFSTEILCQTSLRTGYAMYAGVVLLLRIVKVKGGIRTWRRILFKPS
ncbi:DUF2953 domain-containing protein [Paenibacillus thalictri]|uniref:DUF2953 domain-containing protein n=1 Tax=Paenibacillus thalictri TaxID=2527873 RepID=A0A4Q9DSE2_9BACL|nr:DUF2953 domain-containing protein [Paenibacillus thalictri]TBL79794.1 DUF2953 domain-containing protein [Paenibacillus thalictri]